MSRSNPNENGTPNPATRRFEWNGENGVVRYYDKAKAANVDEGSDFTFILLDQLSSVGGWHDASESSIYSNEVKDTRKEKLVVRAFKAGVLTTGLYKEIKETVASVGGQFNSNLYIAFKGDDDELQIGVLKFKGAALSAWMDFAKENRASLYSQALRINGFNEGKKGKVIFRTPKFELAEISEETNEAATALDATLQSYLKGRSAVSADPLPYNDGNSGSDVDDDIVPF